MNSANDQYKHTTKMVFVSSDKSRYVRVNFETIFVYTLEYE